jgi:hypothetical protein
MANLFLVKHSHEYNTYSRTIRQRPATPDPHGTDTFSVEFSGAGTTSMVNIIMEAYSQKYNANFSLVRQSPAAPNPKGTSGKHCLSPTLHNFSFLHPWNKPRLRLCNYRLEMLYTSNALEPLLPPLGPS